MDKEKLFSKKKLLSGLLSAALLVGTPLQVGVIPGMSVSEATAIASANTAQTVPVNGTSSQTQETKPQLIAETPITAGALLKEYHWETGHGPTKIFVTEVDLTNPYIEFGVIPGRGKLTERLNVTAMARNTGAVAAINGDFYNMQGEGAPIGPMATGGVLVSSPSNLVGWHALGVTKDGKASIETFTFDGKVVAPNGVEFKLSGLNKTPYWEQPQGTHSHFDKLHIYNDMWGGQTRGEDTSSTPTELLVNQEGKVVDISQGKYFDFKIPAGSHILRGHGIAAKFLLDNFQIGDSVQFQYAISPDKDWSVIQGGYSLLVNEGNVNSLSREVLTALDGLRARSAVGVSKDGNTVYMVGVEGRTEDSKGLNLNYLSRFFVEIGAWSAINLDGGGSATMAARPLGDFQAQRVYTPEQVNERLVVNALGVYSTAPQGEVQGLIVGGNQVVLIGEEATFSVKAYDNFYNPLNPAELPVVWSKTGELGTLQGNLFTAGRPGTTEIFAGINGIKAGLPVEVVGKNQVNSLKLAVNSGQVAPGKEVPLSLTLETVSGQTRQVSAHLVDWQFYGIKGEVTPSGKLTITDPGDHGQGIVIARYQGFSAPLQVMVSQERKSPVFEQQNYLSFVAFPQEVMGGLRKVVDPQKQQASETQDNIVTALDYDFTKAVGTTAAYVRLGDGIPLEQEAYGFGLDVYGDGGNQWLRAEIQDGDGNIQRVDLVTAVNWTGWKTVELDLTKHNFVRPATLNRVYVVANEGQQAEKAPQGTLLFKNLRQWSERVDAPVTAKPAVALDLTVGKKQMMINGSPSEMDVAPVIVSGRTLVPVRFVSQALAADVLWDGDNQNVTIVQGDNWIDLWIAEQLMVVNGQAVTLEVAPELINDRTMLPLRAVAEVLDLAVGWDPDTQGITLRN